MQISALFHRFVGRGERRREVPTNKVIVEGLVSQYSEGNISLQMGQYITEEDVEQVRKEVLGHTYRKSSDH